MKRYAANTTAYAPASRRIGAVALALAVIASFAMRFGLLEADVFVLSLVCAAFVALVAVVMAAIALHRIWSFGGAGVPAAIGGAILGGLALVPPGLVLGMLVIHSGTNDLSTNRQDPPAVTIPSAAVEQPVLIWMNTAIEQHIWPKVQQVTSLGQSEVLKPELFNPDIVSRRYRIAPGQLHAAGAKALAGLGWTIVDELPPDLLDAPTYLQAEGTSRILGLKHDVVLRIRPDPVGALLDVRSRAQTPLNDVFDNADRIRAVFSEIDMVLLETYGDLARLAVEEGGFEEEELQPEPVEDPRSKIPQPSFKPYVEEEDFAPSDDPGLSDFEG